MAKSSCCIRNVYFFLVRSLRPQSSSLCQASARALAVLDMGGWKYQFYVENTHQADLDRSRDGPSVLEMRLNI